MRRLTSALLVTSALAVLLPRGTAEGGAPTYGLNVLLTVAPQLPEEARRTLMREATRIWRREQVALHWPAPAGGEAPPLAPLRVLVIARPESAAAGAHRWPVAEILPNLGGRALALASIAGAQRVLDEASRTDTLLEPPSRAEHRLGLVLGRAIAHEIGHFLLDTHAHAEAGLMRATVGAREFAAVAGGTFHLDDDARQWLRARVRAGHPSLQSATVHGFTDSTH